MGVTHEVTNQVPPLAGHDPGAGDTALAEACVRHADVATLDSLKALGALAGSEQAQEWGRRANENPPHLRTHDRYGNRVDEVEFHPAWHELMRTAFGHGLAGAPWADGSPHAHVRRAVGYLGWTQVEMGHGCPVTMTYAAVPALRVAPELAARYEPGLTAPAYEFGLAEPTGKRGLVAGMGMTEKQGGSDVRANTTRAVPNSDGTYALTGHKWFTSAPMSDLFLVLAQLPEGVSCFLVPRVLPDGTRNVFRLQRLKDKLGDRANASSEVEFEGTAAWLVGEPGRGVPTIIEMVNTTRLDCVLGSAATVRAALAQALEVLGGNGYVEESGMPRLYRQAPLNSIWEGSGNVIALDVLRAMGRSSDSLAAVSAEIELARGADPRFDDAVKRLHTELGDPDQLPLRARRIAGLLALCLQGSLLLRHAPEGVADAFCASRLGGDWGAVLGTLPASTAAAEIVDRARIE